MPSASGSFSLSCLWVVPRLPRRQLGLSPSSCRAPPEPRGESVVDAPLMVPPSTASEVIASESGRASTAVTSPSAARRRPSRRRRLRPSGPSRRRSRPCPCREVAGLVLGRVGDLGALLLGLAAASATASLAWPTCSAALSLSVAASEPRPPRRSRVERRGPRVVGLLLLAEGSDGGHRGGGQADGDEPLALAATLLRDRIALEHRVGVVGAVPTDGSRLLGLARPPPRACSRCGWAASRACSAPAARAAAAVAMAAPTLGSTLSTSVDCAASTFGLARSAASWRRARARGLAPPCREASRRACAASLAAASAPGWHLPRRLRRRSLAAASAARAPRRAAAHPLVTGRGAEIGRRGACLVERQPPCGTAWFRTYVLLGPVVLTHPANFGHVPHGHLPNVTTPTSMAYAVTPGLGCQFVPSCGG